MEAHYNKGLIFQRVGKFEEAMSAYHNVISYQPKASKAYNNIGIILKHQGKLGDAINAFKKAIDENLFMQMRFIT